MAALLTSPPASSAAMALRGPTRLLDGSFLAGFELDVFLTQMHSVNRSVSWSSWVNKQARKEARNLNPSKALILSDPKKST